MKVLKFGGSSVSTAERIRKVVAILENNVKEHCAFTVVFSAFGGVTDQLLLLAKKASVGNLEYRSSFDELVKRHFLIIQDLFEDTQAEIFVLIQQNHAELKNILDGIYLLQEASSRSLDLILSFGERNSALVIAHYMKTMGMNAQFVDARALIVTNDKFGSAIVDFGITNSKIVAHYSQHVSDIQVVTGFIGATAQGTTTTLGRGGSDYTAAIIGAALDAENIEIWTDVDGVLTADPRKVKKAFTIPKMTYAEAMEMSHFGAKVIYPPTLQPAFTKKIPLYIKNTFNPSFAGTLISNEGNPAERVVQGISSIDHIALLTLFGSGLFGVPGIAGRLFSALAANQINVILITQGSSESSISFVVQPSDAQAAKTTIEKTFELELLSGLIEPVKIESNLSIVAVVGEQMRYQPGIAGKLFHALGVNGINIVAIAQGSSELNISVVIPALNETKALNVIHESFFLSDVKTLHVYMVGTGLIGKTLLKQLEQQKQYLQDRLSIEIKIVGLANSRKMIFDSEGISLTSWLENLDHATTTHDMDQFFKRIVTDNLPNTIFIDNTANPDIGTFYGRILDASVSISTPNKIALSSNYQNYSSLKKIAAKRGVKFVYETTVGAGLPVITTLQNLIISGDRIVKIEGVLSGSLSYIFNNYVDQHSFSDVLAKAKDLGLTEPDPRVDLSGADVRRKLVILARETGVPINQEDIKMESFLPEACQTAGSVAAFYEAVQQNETFFERLKAKAQATGTAIRMIAKFEDGVGTIGLQYVGPENPLFHLSGSDNMIVFTTSRYFERPLVIKGPGAGSEVTAAGIFAEVVSLAKNLG